MNYCRLLLQFANGLKRKILENFWDEGRGAFIDSAVSGKKHISRHHNIFAVLYDFVDDTYVKKITENVLNNPNVAAITTPYFKFFELMVYAKIGKIEEVMKTIESYWGGMIDLGATTVWEEYNPNMRGLEHYAMYGRKFEKSLCHAWGSGPIALIAKCLVGIKATSVGYSSFEISPDSCGLNYFESVIPVADGTVRVKYSKNTVTVLSSVPGGVFKFAGKEFSIPEGEPVSIAE